MLLDIHFPVAKGERGTKIPAHKAARLMGERKRPLRLPRLSGRERNNPDGSSLPKMIAHGTWLACGTAVLDDQGRVLHSNDEFALWAGSSTLVFPFVTELIGQRFPLWAEEIEGLLQSPDIFQETHLEDTTSEPTQWYKIELTAVNGARVLRVSRCLPPLAELTEHSFAEFDQDEYSRRELYTRLIRAEGQLQMLSGRWPGVLFTQRPDFTFSFISQKVEDWTGLSAEELCRRPERFWEVVHEADAPELQVQIARCRGREPITSTFRLRHVQTGRVTYLMERRQALVSGNGLVLGYDGAWVDVTRQTIAEKRLGSAVWKETLAVLTMGLAHDFSNILAGIHALSETFESQPPQAASSSETFGLIKKNALQATQLVQRILNLHQGKVGQRNYYHANELVTDTLEVLRKTLRRINLSTSFSTESLPLYIDPVEFRQVLVNLALNAADAMPDGGSLHIGTALLPIPPRWRHLQGTLPKPPFVAISVADSGTGISPEHLPQIFDPFFTTKPFNKGSGLGLYNARLFVEKHSGAIGVDTEENVGTTFTLLLPLADFTETERLCSSNIASRKTLLLLDPSNRALEATAQWLRECGFYVAASNSERAAVELLHSPDYQFDGVLVVLNGVSKLSPRLFNELDRLKLPIKRMIQIAGSNQDEHDSTLLGRADLVIGCDVPPQEIANRLRGALGVSS